MELFSKNGRYAEIGKIVNDNFSESNYYRNCCLLEFIHAKHFILNLRNFTPILPSFYEEIVEDRAEIEKVLNYCIKLLKEDRTNYIVTQINDLQEKYKHDIVAVQYFSSSFFRRNCTEKIRNQKYLSDLFHFGLTSQDIVNTVWTKMVLDFNPTISNLLSSLKENISSFNKSGNPDILILGNTHGQKAVPFSKEHNYNVQTNPLDDFQQYLTEYHDREIMVKFGTGAVGGNFSKELIGITPYETKINIETIYEFFDGKTVLINYNSFQNDLYPKVREVLYVLKDIALWMKNNSINMWLMSSKGYINKKSIDFKEHGSSTMPQKSNPINFENCEGNCDLLIGMIDTVYNKLSVSRMQRDLSDLTVMRNIPLIYCYLLQAIKSINKGFSEYQYNDEKLKEEFSNSMEIFLESIQLSNKLKGDVNSKSYEEIKQAYFESENKVKFIQKMSTEIGGKFSLNIDELLKTMS